MPNIEINNAKLLYETRSEEVQEIIGRLPSWILRWGITVIGLVLGSVFIGANFLKYPDKTMAKVIINAAHPPVKVLSASSGLIQKILVKQDDIVKENDVLMIMDSKASMEDVAYLKNQLDDFLRHKSISTLPTQKMSLGELQNSFNDVVGQINSFQYFSQHDASITKVNQIKSQIVFNKNKAKNLGSNQPSIKQNNLIDKQLFEADKKLFENGAISENEYLTSKKRYLDQQIVKQTNPINIEDKQQQIFELQQNLLSISAEKQKEIFEYQLKIETAVKILLEQIRQWELKYIIKAPVDGKVNLFAIWQANQIIQANEAILLITPFIQETAVRGFIPISNAGEVKVGQKVLLDIVTHPQNKYGYVEGELSFVSDVPMDSVYAIEMKLKNGLITTNKKTIPSLPILYANAQIITKDVSVLDRLFEKFKAISNQ
jgi:multidrug efflux pump subunit AcrA (membrane-fusion protein)